MTDPMEKSMQGTSEFISFNSSTMEQSMCGISEKVLVNISEMQKERLKDQSQFQKMQRDTKNKSIQQQVEEDEDENQFLNVGKWSKEKRCEQPTQNITNTRTQQQHNQIVKQTPHLQQSSKWLKKTIPKNASQVNHEEQRKDQQQEEEEEDAEDEEEEEEDEEDEEDEEEDDDDEQQQDQDQQEQQDSQDEQGQEEVQESNAEEQESDMNKSDAQISQSSSQALKTQTINTSAIPPTPKPSKWAKKAPLQTMTKYQTKLSQPSYQNKSYHSNHSKYNTVNDQQQQGDQVQENEIIKQIDEEPNQWSKVEKVLVRLKLLLS